MSARADLAAFGRSTRRRAGGSRLAPHLVVLMATAIWGANAAVIKVGLRHVQPISFTAARFLLGGLLLAGIALVARKPAWRPPPARLVIPGALVGMVLNQLSFSTALSLSTAVDVSLVMGLGPLAAALLVFVISRRGPSRRQALALLLGLIGVGLVVLQSGRVGGGSLIGDLIALGSPLSWSLYLLLLSRASGRVQPFVFLSWASLIAAAVLAAPAIWVWVHSHDSWPDALPALLYSSVLATAVAYSAYFWAVPRLGIAGTVIYTYLQPVIGALAGTVLLHEDFGWGRAAGAALILIAAYLGAHRTARTGGVVKKGERAEV